MISQTVNGLNIAEHLGKTPEQLLLLFNFPSAFPLTRKVLAEGNKWGKGVAVGAGASLPCVEELHSPTNEIRDRSAGGGVCTRQFS